MQNPNSQQESRSARIQKNTFWLGLWTAAWVLTMALVAFGPKFIWESNQTITIVAIATNLAIGIGMIIANKRHLHGLDEMHQKIQLEAMALALGVGLVIGLSYSNLADANIIPFSAEISHLIIVMTLTYASGIFFGLRRFR